MRRGAQCHECTEQFTRKYDVSRVLPSSINLAERLRDAYLQTSVFLRHTASNTKSHPLLFALMDHSLEVLPPYLEYLAGITYLRA
jgi:hypothetical protein